MTTIQTNEGLKREIGIWGLSANMINIIIGSGIFVLPAIVAGILGPASIVAYAFCGLLMLLIMLCFAEVGSKTTKSGGAYVETAFGKYPGFLVFMTMFIATICAVAAVTNALFSTLTAFFPILNYTLIKISFFAFIFQSFKWVQGFGPQKFF